MLENLKRVLADLFTGRDGRTHDIGRWSWALSSIAVVGAAGWTLAHGGAVQLRDLAESLGIVSAAHGATLFAKAKTEPGAP